MSDSHLNYEMSSRLHNEYSKKIGSNAIAKLSALKTIQWFCASNLLQPKFNVLEIGAGIGTITELLLRITDSDIYVHEMDEYCQSQLRLLQIQFPSRLKIGSIIENQNYEMIIIDGPFGVTEISIAIQNSLNLKFILFESGRLGSRLKILRLITKHRFRAQYWEFRNNEYKSTLAVLFLEKHQKQKLSQIYLDFIKIYFALNIK